jgi:hypothetical protein
MPEVISNTGPLIALASIGQFDLLHKLFGTIHIPSAVRSEILDQNTLNAVTVADWVVVCTTQDEIAECVQLTVRIGAQFQPPHSLCWARCGEVERHEPARQLTLVVSRCTHQKSHHEQTILRPLLR